MSVTDFSQGSTKAVFDLINRSNNTNFSDTQLDLVNLTNTGPKSVTVQATAKQFSGYHGQVTLGYNRVGLDEIPDVTAGEVEYDLSKYSGLFTYFMDMHGVKMDHNDILVNDQQLDVIDSDIVQEYDVPQNFKITARPGSFAWVGEVNLVISRMRVDLKDIWTVQVLDGLMSPPRIFNWPAEPVMASPDGNFRVFQDGSVKIFLTKPAEEPAA